MVSQRRVLLVLFGIVVVVAGVWGVSYWRWRAAHAFVAEYYDPDAYREFTLTIDGKPAGPELEVQEKWDVAIDCLRPAEYPPTTVFTSMINISARDDAREYYGCCVVDPPGGQWFTSDVGGIQSPPTLDDGRIHLQGVLISRQQGADLKDLGDLKDLVGQPLTMWVWMYPRDERGEQRKEDIVLVMQHDFQFVHSQGE
jgi:hypothetical protein